MYKFLVKMDILGEDSETINWVHRKIHREMIKYVKDNLGKDLVGVEIGTLYGDNAKNMLKFLPIKKLYCIDPYIDYKELRRDYLQTQNQFNKTFNSATKRLKRYKDKVTFIKKYSYDAVNDIPDNLDFVYIDGNHAYEYVKQDYELYYPKVKKGGVIGGHDMGTEGVTKFFLEVAPGKDYHVYFSDWWIVK